MNETDFALFEKLIRIHAIAPDFLEDMLALVRAPAEYVQQMTALEATCAGSATDILPDPVACLLSKHLLRDTILRPPLLSQAPPASFGNLAAFADVRPGVDGMPESRDPVFMYIARLVADQGGRIDVKQLMIQDFAKLVELDQTQRGILRNLRSFLSWPRTAMISKLSIITSIGW